MLSKVDIRAARLRDGNLREFMAADLAVKFGLHPFPLVPIRNFVDQTDV